jgi:hypothetical protein
MASRIPSESSNDSSFAGSWFIDHSATLATATGALIGVLEGTFALNISPTSA